MIFKFKKTEDKTNHIQTIKEIRDKTFKQQFPYVATEEDFDADLEKILSHSMEDLETGDLISKKSFNAQIKEADIKEIDSLIETVKLMPMVVFERDENGNTPLHETVLKRGFEMLIVEIVNAGAEIEAYNNQNQTPADIAVSPAVSAGLIRHAAKQKAFMHQEAVYCKKNKVDFSADKNQTGDAPHIVSKDIRYSVNNSSREKD